ncbi:MAG TPA: hypothetical protein VNL17_01190 [Verrucomicrobiae bacterium]|nr:hypothetical protein [Verrucomicrobiae bacterium]
MDWLIIWTVLISVMALLGWLACSYFWRYYAIFKHLVWGCLVLLVGFLSYGYGVDRGAWVVRDAYHGTREVKADGSSSGVNLSNDSSTTQENAKMPFFYDTIVAGFLMYCVLMLLVGGQIVNNSARKAAPRAVEREGLFDGDSPTLNR